MQGNLFRKSRSLDSSDLNVSYILSKCLFRSSFVFTCVLLDLIAVFIEIPSENE